jgi:hypothetical protein
MGCGMSAEEKEGKARNEEIENQLRRDRMQQRNEIKMLLLGRSFESKDGLDSNITQELESRANRQSSNR